MVAQEAALVPQLNPAFRAHSLTNDATLDERLPTLLRQAAQTRGVCFFFVSVCGNVFRQGKALLCF